MFNSKLKQSEATLAYMQSILDTVRDPLLVLDHELRIVTASRSFCRVFQVTPEATVGQYLPELGKGQWNHPHLQQTLKNVLAQQTSFDEYEVTQAFPQIGERTMLLHARKIWREGNQPALILLVMEDVTERKASEEKLAALRRDLERSNADLESFAQIAGHDLRAPLNSIVQFSQLLQRRTRNTLDQDCQEFLQHILAAGQRMSELLTDLLQYALLTQAHPTAMPVPSTVHLACEQAVANLSAAIRESQAKILCSIPTEAQVRMENSRLVQIFQNLISNGMQYCRADSRPLLQTTGTLAGDHWRLAVQDNGIGIEEQYWSRIFQPFQRLHGHERPGSGLGLATCQRIIEQAGGTMTVESQPGQGSTFYFWLPKA